MVAAANTIGHDSRVLGLIGSGHFLSHFYQLTFPPLILDWQAEFNATFVQLGIIMSLFGLFTGLAQIPAGMIVDKIGARPVLVVGLIVEGLAIAAMGLADSMDMLYLLAIIAGTGNCVFHPADYAILNTSIDERRMGRAFSLHTFSGHLGGAIAPATIIFLTTLYDWRITMMLIGGIGIAVAALVFFQGDILKHEVIAKPTELDETEETLDNDGQSMVQIMLSKQMALFFLFFVLASLTSGGVYSFSVVALVNIHHVGLGVAGTALTFFLFASAVGILIGGVAADRAGAHEWVAIICFLLSAVIFAAFAFLTFTAFIMIALFAIAGLAQGIVRPARDMMVRAVAPKGSTGRVFGFVSTGIALGSAIAPVFFGWVIDQGQPTFIFWLLTGFSVVAALIVMEHKRVG